MAWNHLWYRAGNGGGDTVAATIEAVIAPIAFSGAVSQPTISGAIAQPVITGTVTLEQLPATITLPAFTGEADQ